MPTGTGKPSRLQTWLPASLRAHPKWPTFEHWLIKLGHFFLGQGLLQILMAVSGFFLLRWMSVREYAIYTLTFSIQSAMFAFSDVGFSNAIIPLVGQRVNDRQIIGRYVGAARSLRRLLLPIVIICGAIGLFVSGAKQNLDFRVGALLFALATVAVWFNATSALFTNPILIRQDLGFLHTVQNIMAIVRFGLFALGHVIGWFGSIFVFIANTVLSIGQAFFIRKRGRTHVDEPQTSSPEVVEARREMLHFIRPQVPIILFQAIQGQIMVFIVSFVGTSTALANMGAATRLSQLFAFAPFLCGWIIQPYFARVPTAEAPRKFFQILAAGFLGLAVLPVTAILWPDPFLWLLGKHYDNLDAEVRLVLTAGTIGTSTAFLVTMCFARGWLRDDAIIWIATITTGMQVVGVIFEDVSTAAGTLLLILWVSCGAFVTYFVLAMFGMRKEIRAGGRR